MLRKLDNIEFLLIDDLGHLPHVRRQSIARVSIGQSSPGSLSHPVGL